MARTISRLMALLGLVLCFHTHGICHEGEAPLDIITPYHFPSSLVTVNSDVPLGTVIATVEIPESPAIALCRGHVLEGIWRNAALRERFVMVPSNVPGIGVRVVSEKRGRPVGVDNGLEGKVGTLPHFVTQGGLRIELVKMGPIQSGALGVPWGTVQYRMYMRGMTDATLVARESFQHVGALFIEVTERGMKAFQVS